MQEMGTAKALAADLWLHLNGEGLCAVITAIRKGLEITPQSAGVCVCTYARADVQSNVPQQHVDLRKSERETKWRSHVNSRCFHNR